MRIGKKAILFDRDGVLNIDSGYVYRYENIRWIDGAREAVARLTEEGWLFVCCYQSKRCGAWFLYGKRCDETA